MHIEGFYRGQELVTFAWYAETWRDPSCRKRDRIMVFPYADRSDVLYQQRRRHKCP
jgi:hypothetical protein